MKEAKVKFESLLDFFNTSYVFLMKNPKCENQKIGYAILKVRKANEKFINDFEDEKDNERLRLCLTDKDTKEVLYSISRDNKGNEVKSYKFEPNKQIELNKKIKSLVEEWKDKEVEIKNHIISKDDIPDNITELEREVFKGFVLE